MYRFSDPEQNMYERTATPPDLGETFSLERNLRSTRQIAECLDAVWGVHFDREGPDGPPPVFLPAERPEEQLAMLRNEIHRFLVRERLRTDQVVILTSSTAALNRLLALRELVGHAVWRSPQGVADSKAAGRPEGALQIDTVHRFKGLESDAVILLLDEVETLRDKRVAYVGMGRARSVLTVIGPEQAQEALNWNEPS